MKNPSLLLPNSSTNNDGLCIKPDGLYTKHDAFTRGALYETSNDFTTAGVAPAGSSHTSISRTSISRTSVSRTSIGKDGCLIEHLSANKGVRESCNRNTVFARKYLLKMHTERGIPPDKWVIFS